ncbi:MAG: permease-like cell division protein FtsX [Bacteroidales bacterium]|nr:permease-like cell division protein FtsX [Candidatus Colimorpha onthohippi]
MKFGTNSTTILSITFVLLVMGLILIIEYHSYRQTYNAQERITYKVDLTPDVSDSAAVALTDSIAQLPYIKQVDYISKEEAAEIFSNEIGEDFVDFIGYNPLYPSILVNFKADLVPNRSSRILNHFCHDITKLPIVTGVAYQEHVVDALHTAFYKLTWFLVFFELLLVIICYVMIRNTIRISLISQRESIQTMRLVGATTRFITRPYLWNSILYGAIGGAIADALLFLTFYIFNHEFSFALLHPDHWLWYGIIAAVLVVLGIITSWLSTVITIQRYLLHD